MTPIASTASLTPVVPSRGTARRTVHAVFEVSIVFAALVVPPVALLQLVALITAS